MVERLQATLNPALFVDLDGTLLKANSMRLFMKRLPLMLLRAKAPAATFCALWSIFLRVLKISDHRMMKWRLTGLARQHLKDKDWADFATSLVSRINPVVNDLIKKKHREGCRIFIATAAPGEYAIPLADFLGYDGVVATAYSNTPEDYHELRGERKLFGINDLINHNNLTLDTFLTDHSDDLPTAQAYPDQTLLVDPTDDSASKFLTAGVSRRIIT
ncbi:MAG: haloacid dehalogenase-like hydrolase [Muribaculaceae bacterium]|nr:haloacid dehalogenase-like hydrolase [Muribaculaceae bacterium]